MKKEYSPTVCGLFAKVEEIYAAATVEQNKVTSVVNNLKFSKKQIVKYGEKRKRRILVYCIDELLAMINDGNVAKVCAFAGVIKDMPDSCRGRKFRALLKKIDKFNEKFGDDCFEMIKSEETMRPRFTKRAPNDAYKFFSPRSDDIFKAAHPIGYVVLIVMGLIAFLAPLIGYAIYAELTNSLSSGGWPLLAFFGCLVMGVGLFNIVAAFLHQYLGHRLTAICLISGGAIVGVSTFMANHPELYNAEVSFFYFISLAMMLFPAMIYVYFRDGVASWLKHRRISRTRIKKLTKGKRGFWWYENLHKEVNLGLLYHLNKIFTILFALILLLTLFTGFIKVMSLVIAPLNIILYVLTAVMTLFARIQDNLERHKKPFVIIGRSWNGGIDSIVFDVMIVLGILALGYVQLILLGDVWGINIR